MDESLGIDGLMKVSLDIWKAPSPASVDLDQPPTPVTFIFGVGPGGLSEIEYALAGKKKGDRVTLTLSPNTFHAIFSHLACQFHGVAGDHSKPISLVIQVTGVSRAENREVVKAMAGGTGSSCSGGCDCGCGC